MSLLDTNIGAEDSEVISAFDNMTLIELMSKLKFQLIEALDSDGNIG